MPEDETPMPNNRFQRIVAVITVNQELNREIAKTAYDLAEIAGGKVYLLSVIPSVAEMVAIPSGVPMASAAPPVYEDNVQNIKNRNDVLFNLKSEYGTKVETEIEVSSGHIEEMITDFADVKKADIIVVGSPNRSWLEALFEPSTARSVTKAASCPVLVVPEPA